jgi:hypothetical protein
VRISRRALLIAVAGRLWAQEAKYSTGVDVVTLLATVRDAHGLLAKNLSREDFLLEEDGVPQTIRYFSRESDLPLTVGLLVDTSQSQFHVLEPERRASYTFLDQVLREGQDQAFVAHFDVSREGTTELYLLAERSRGGTRSTGGPMRLSTLLYDAIRDCSENLSDGVDFRSKTSLRTAIEYA